MRVAVFDLDGTLADTAEDLIAAANGALAEVGLGMPLDPVKHRATAFAGGRAMLRLAAPESMIEAAYPRLLEHYRAKIDVHTRLYPGVEAALDCLMQDSWALAVCTNKPLALAELLLERLGLRGRFAAVLGADSLPVRKPDPRHLLETIARAGGDPRCAVLVGDTATDRNAARSASVPCVLVTFGPECQGVERLEPEAVLADYSELAPLLTRLVPRI